jgi:hypothetical protein
MQQNISTYYRLLNLPETATLAQVKKAYRTKALQLHPDRNTSATAHQDFIALTEAYEYLCAYLSSDEIKPQWQPEETEQVRQRAEEYAGMTFDDFAESDYYKTSAATATVLDHLFFFISLFFVIGVPIIGYVIAKGSGVAASLFIVVLSARGWGPILTINRPEINLPEAGRAFLILAQQQAFINGVSALANLFIFFLVTLNTQIPSWDLTGWFLILIMASGIISKFLLQKRKYFNSPTTNACATVSIVNLFFLLNFAFAHNPKQETYPYETEGRQAFIDLPENRYAAYPWFRSFFDYDAMKGTTTITYTFEDGAFGLRVLKEYKFNTVE